MTDTRIVVEKSSRRLTLYEADTLVHTCAVGLGSAPSGHKEREGDGRTPEGIYYLCTRNARSKYHLSLGLSYPGADDAERAFNAGMIDRRARDLIFQATLAGRRPPWDTALGGFIMLHGGGTGDWTAGCVAMNDRDIERLFAACPLGTPVEIRP